MDLSPALRDWLRPIVGEVELVWPRFIPLQVDGRAPVDGPGMAGRVRETIHRTLDRAG